MAKRKRRFGSVATELIKKAREAMLTAVQIFNNPQIEFKAELFIVTTVVPGPTCCMLSIEGSALSTDNFGKRENGGVSSRRNSEQLGGGVLKNA
jgi:Domain of unknown function (DUF3644)